MLIYIATILSSVAAKDFSGSAQTLLPLDPSISFPSSSHSHSSSAFPSSSSSSPSSAYTAPSSLSTTLPILPSSNYIPSTKFFLTSSSSAPSSSESSRSPSSAASVSPTSAASASSASGLSAFPPGDDISKPTSVTPTGLVVEEARGWTLLSHSSSRAYLHLQGLRSWTQAEDVCQALYGHLARDDPGGVLREFIERKGLGGDVWVGLHQPSPQEPFRWVDEFSWMSDWVSSSVWKEEGQEGRGQEEEYHQSLCVALNIDQQYRWDTRYCAGEKVGAAICQIEVPGWLRVSGGCELGRDWVKDSNLLYFPDNETLRCQCGETSHTVCTIENPVNQEKSSCCFHEPEEKDIDAIFEQLFETQSSKPDKWDKSTNLLYKERRDERSDVTEKSPIPGSSKLSAAAKNPENKNKKHDSNAPSGYYEGGEKSLVNWAEEDKRDLGKQFVSSKLGKNKSRDKQDNDYTWQRKYLRLKENTIAADPPPVRDNPPKVKSPSSVEISVVVGIETASDESPERPTEENQPNWVLSKESSGSKPSSIVTQGSSGSNSSAESQSTITSDNRVYSTTDVFTKGSEVADIVSSSTELGTERTPGTDLGAGAKRIPRTDLGLGAEMTPGTDLEPGAKRTPGTDLGLGPEMTPGTDLGPGAEMTPGTDLSPGAEMTPGTDLSLGAEATQMTDQTPTANLPPTENQVMAGTLSNTSTDLNNSSALLSDTSTVLNNSSALLSDTSTVLNNSTALLSDTSTVLNNSSNKDARVRRSLRLDDRLRSVSRRQFYPQNKQRRLRPDDSADAKSSSNPF